jgi:hypothetical protein
VFQDGVQNFLTVLLGLTCWQLEFSERFCRIGHLVHRWSPWLEVGLAESIKYDVLALSLARWDPMEQVVEMMSQTGVDSKWGLR